MLVSWYLPTLGFSLWPCVILLLIFIPVSIWHERNWRRTLAAYARLRREAGASDVAWPQPGQSFAMDVQPGLLLLACGMLAGVVAIAAGAALMWPRTPPGFDLPINPYDLPYLWSMIVAATAAIVAGVAIAIDAWRSPWSKVAWRLRRAIHASPALREQLFAEALALDPGLREAPAQARSPQPPVGGPPSAPTPTPPGAAPAAPPPGPTPAPPLAPPPPARPASPR